eukprot:2774433-Rhodomonas_salina.1
MLLHMVQIYPDSSGATPILAAKCAITGSRYCSTPILAAKAAPACRVSRTLWRRRPRFWRNLCWESGCLGLIPLRTGVGFWCAASSTDGASAVLMERVVEDKVERTVAQSSAE